VATDTGSTPAGFCVFSDPGEKIFEKPDGEPLFVFGSSRNLRGLRESHLLITKIVNFGSIGGFRSLNRSRILKFEKT